MFIHRSLLFLPGSNARAIEKSRALPCDVIIFDLEDAVAPEKKAEARTQVLKAATETDFGDRRKVVRINALSSAWGRDDLAAFAKAPIDALMLPKVEQAVPITEVSFQTALPLWCNIETPMGVLNAPSIAAHPSVEALVAGTNDLSAALKIARTPDRFGLLHSLSAIVLAARAHGKLAFDGTFTDIPDLSGLRAEAFQGKQLGFDGKTLIHPSHIDTMNEVFGPSPDQTEEARSIVAAYEQAQREGKAVAVHKGRMIEELHMREAQELLKLAKLIAQRK